MGHHPAGQGLLRSQLACLLADLGPQAVYEIAFLWAVFAVSLYVLNEEDSSDPMSIGVVVLILAGFLGRGVAASWQEALVAIVAGYGIAAAFSWTGLLSSAHSRLLWASIVALPATACPVFSSSLTHGLHWRSAIWQFAVFTLLLLAVVRLIRFVPWYNQERRAMPVLAVMGASLLVYLQPLKDIGSTGP